MPALYTPSLMDLAREHPALPSGRLDGLPPVSEAARVAADRQTYLTEEFSRRMREIRKEPLTRWDGTTFEHERP